MTLNCVSIYLLRLIGLWQTDRQTRDDSIYTVSQKKTRHQTHAHNFPKC